MNVNIGTWQIKNNGSERLLGIDIDCKLNSENHINQICTKYYVKNIISPNFLVWKFCGKAQFLHRFERIARNYAETVPFHKISTPGNQVKLR